MNYDGLVFQAVHDNGGPTPAEAGASTTAPRAHYHQDGDLVWADFAGGEVRRGSLAGRCAPDGSLELAYAMVMAGGEVVAGHCLSTPEQLPDGRIRLREQWRRFSPHLAEGVSVIEQVR